LSYATNDKIYAFASRRRYNGDERPPGLCRVIRKCIESPSAVTNPGIQVDSGVEIDQQITICISIPLTEENWQPFAVNELICISGGRIIDKRE
jgi:hypothetical protein